MAWTYQADQVQSASFLPTGTGSFVILGPNQDRKMFTIRNDTPADLYVKPGAAASSSTFMVRMPSGSFYEGTNPVWNGAIYGAFSASGSIGKGEAYDIY